MLIQEWFARAVAAGLMPDWKNIRAYRSLNGKTQIHNEDNENIEEYFEIGIDTGEFARAKLRKDGKDLYSLEWRKPTESNVGEMCWLMDEFGRIRLESLESWHLIKQMCEFQILLADHGQIAPTEQDFKKVYGE